MSTYQANLEPTLIRIRSLFIQLRYQNSSLADFSPVEDAFWNIKDDNQVSLTWNVAVSVSLCPIHSGVMAQALWLGWFTGLAFNH